MRSCHSLSCLLKRLVPSWARACRVLRLFLLLAFDNVSYSFGLVCLTVMRILIEHFIDICVAATRALILVFSLSFVWRMRLSTLLMLLVSAALQFRWAVSVPT